MSWIVEDVSELRGMAVGQTVYVLGTGPSLDSFPIEHLSGSITIGLNTIANIFLPTLWMFGDGKFARWGAKRYKDKIGASSTALVVNERHVHFLERHYSGLNTHLYRFTNKDEESSRFLAGRWTIVTVALSLATLLEARRVVLIGIDMGAPEGQFYSTKVDGVAPGRQLSLMGQWRKWLQYGFRQNLWPVEIVTVSPYFQDFCPGTPIRSVSIEESFL